MTLEFELDGSKNRIILNRKTIALLLMMAQGYRPEHALEQADTLLGEAA